MDALGPGCRAAQDEHRSVVLGALSGDRPGVVAGVALVLVGGFVLLVHHDQSDVFQRREGGRARAHADPGLAPRQAQPLIAAGSIGQPRVQYGDRLPEAGREPPERLGSHRDLRHQHDRTPAAAKGLADRPEVDLGLARPRNAMKQKPPHVPLTDRGEDGLKRRPLSFRERRGRGRRGTDPIALRCPPGSAVLAGAAALSGAGSQHEGQGARGRRAVLLCHPPGQRDEVGGNRPRQFGNKPRRTIPPDSKCVRGRTRRISGVRIRESLAYCADAGEAYRPGNRKQSPSGAGCEYDQAIKRQTRWLANGRFRALFGDRNRHRRKSGRHWAALVHQRGIRRLQFDCRVASHECYG